MSVRMCHICVLYYVHVKHIVNFVCLFLWLGWICSLYRTLNVRPVCPTYLSRYSLHFNWYTPLRLYASFVLSLRFRWFRSALVVLNAILMLVFLNNFVTVLVLLLLLLLLWLYSPWLGLGRFSVF
jgi:hypothetical protein